MMRCVSQNYEFMINFGAFKVTALAKKLSNS
jgi:hypothetical protein